MNKITSFIGSLLVIAVAVGIFMMLMEKEMPQENRELLIAFVSVLFGAMASSIKKITGDE
jgi:multisubunit Na+/H+ antiporter MnhB subunit